MSQLEMALKTSPRKFFENFAPPFSEKEVKGCFCGFNNKHRLGKSACPP
jgi:hypothetical protein